jgi:hypothetical protein
VTLLADGGAAGSFGVAEVYETMVAGGSSWPQATVAKTMLRMTRPDRRPPLMQLERLAVDRYRVALGI